MNFLNNILDSVNSMSLLEVLAVITGIASVWLAKKENLLVYPIGIISVLIYVWLCWGVKLYAHTGINLFFFCVSIYGWFNWLRKKEDNTMAVSIKKNSRNENFLSICIMVLLWAVLYFILLPFQEIGTPVIVTLTEAFTTAMCFVGMWLMAWKRVENWIFWIVADLIHIPLYIYKELHITTIQFFIFTIIAYLGYREWSAKVKAT